MNEKLRTSEDILHRRIERNRFTRLGPQTPQEIQPDMEIATQVVHSFHGHDQLPGEYSNGALRKDLIHNVGAKNLLEVATLIPQIANFPSKK